MKSVLILMYLYVGMYGCIKAEDSLNGRHKNFYRQVVEITMHHRRLNIVLDTSIVHLYCDTLPQIKFWERVWELSPDSAIVNVAHNRQIIDIIDMNWWRAQSQEWKYGYRDSIRKCLHLPDTSRILLTTGKKHYYVWDSVFYLIDQAISVFIDNETDPWYAQSILLIESPRGNWRSRAGARGYFQLMKPVARKFGLKVNRHIDERLNFERSAYAAAMLIKTVCIPETKKMLDSLRIPYSEDALWFKLLCMHVYHAGALNVRRALFKSDCREPSIKLIYCLWQMRTGAFQSASQNYSQLILTAYIRMYKKLDLLRCLKTG